MSARPVAVARPRSLAVADQRDVPAAVVGAGAALHDGAGGPPGKGRPRCTCRWGLTTHAGGSGMPWGVGPDPLRVGVEPDGGLAVFAVHAGGRAAREGHGDSAGADGPRPRRLLPGTGGARPDVPGAATAVQARTPSPRGEQEEGAAGGGHDDTGLPGAGAGAGDKACCHGTARGAGTRGARSQEGWKARMGRPCKHRACHLVGAENPRRSGVPSRPSRCASKPVISSPPMSLVTLGRSSRGPGGPHHLRGVAVRTPLLPAPDLGTGVWLKPA